MSLGWGIVGIGKLADMAMAPAIGRDANSRLVAVCSRSHERAVGFAESHSAEHAYSEYNKMLEDPGVDIVYIATPNSLHKDQTVAALKAGKHVLVEKPMALTSEEGREIVEVARECERKVGVGFHLRHKLANQTARDVIQSGQLGRLFLAQLSIGAGKDVFPYDTWRADDTLAGGGTMLHQGSHIIDLLGFLSGLEVKEVSCSIDQSPGEDVFLANCRLDDGVLATLSSHQLMAGASFGWLMVGTDSWLQGVGATSPRAGDKVFHHSAGTAILLATTEVSAYDSEIASFADAVLGNGEINGTAEDGLKSIEIFEALYRSAREGRVVSVPAGVGSS